MRKKKTILEKIKEFETYDRVYYEGKLTSLLIVIIMFICIILLGVIIWTI